MELFFKTTANSNAVISLLHRHAQSHHSYNVILHKDRKSVVIAIVMV